MLDKYVITRHQFYTEAHIEYSVENDECYKIPINKDISARSELISILEGQINNDGDENFRLEISFINGHAYVKFADLKQLTVDEEWNDRHYD